MLENIASTIGSFKYYLLNILLISFGPFFRGDYEVFFADHAMRRAAQRQIPLDLLERTVFEGIARYKNNTKIVASC